MPNKISLFAALALVLTFASTTSAAQITFVPSLSVTEEYTDNLDLTNDNERESFTTIPSASLAFTISSPARDLAIVYNPSYSIYHSYSEYNSFRHNASAVAGMDLGRATRFEISDSFLKTEDPVTDDLIFEEDPTVRRERQTYYRNTAGAELTHQFGPSDTFAVGYQYTTLENEDPTVEDNRRHMPSASIVYWLNPRWGTETELTYEKGEFEDAESDLTNTKGRFRLTRHFSQQFQTFAQYAHTILKYEDGRDDYQVYDPSLGVSWNLDADSTLTLAAGYYIRDPENGDSDSGLSLNGDLGRKWTFKRSSLSLTGSSGYDQSYFGAENLGFSKYYQIRGNAMHQFSRQFSGDIFGSYRHTKYEELTDNRKDKLATVGCGLRYQVTQQISSRLSYSYRDLDSNEDENDYTENRVMLMLSISPASPFKW